MRNRNVCQHVYLAPSSEHYEWAMYKLCLRVVKRGKFVLLMTKYPIYLPLLISVESAELCQLERFVIMLMEDLESVHAKLFQLKDWVLLPDVIIVDLRSFIEEVRELNPQPNDSAATSLVRRIAHCAACLLDYANRVQRRKAERFGDISLSDDERPADEEVNDEVFASPIPTNECTTIESPSTMLTPLTPSNPSEVMTTEATVAEANPFCTLSPSPSSQDDDTNVEQAIYNNPPANEKQVPQLIDFASTEADESVKSNCALSPLLGCSASFRYRTGSCLPLTQRCLPTSENKAGPAALLQFLQQSIVPKKPALPFWFKPVDAVFIMSRDPAPMTQRQLEVIIVLYFYNQRVCYDFAEIERRVHKSQKLSS